MIKLDRILIAHDISSTSRQAAGLALKLAEDLGAQLHMLTVDIAMEDADTIVGIKDKVETRCQEAEEWLREVSAQLLQEVGIESEALVIKHAAVHRADPARAVVRYAEEHDIDLIVTGTHGRQGVKRAILGSVTADVLRSAPCPVLTVRPEAWSPTQTIHKVLTPVDFSKPSRNAVRYASQLAELYEAQFLAMYVVEFPTDVVEPEPRPSDTSSSSEESPYHEQLHALTRDLPVEANLHVVGARPAENITSFARQYGVDLIVMPTRGHGGLKRLLIGSVTEKVIATAPCPVVSAKDFGAYV